MVSTTLVKPGAALQQPGSPLTSRSLRGDPTPMVGWSSYRPARPFDQAVAGQRGNGADYGRSPFSRSRFVSSFSRLPREGLGDSSAGLSQVTTQLLFRVCRVTVEVAATRLAGEKWRSSVSGRAPVSPGGQGEGHRGLRSKQRT